MKVLRKDLPRLVKTFGILLTKPSFCRIMPLHLQIEPTSACNLRCQFCSRDRNGKDRMDFETFRALFDRIRPFRMTFSGSGEPLLNKETLKMVEYASKKGASTVITTNFTIGKRVAEEIVLSGLQGLRVSIDAARKETYRSIRGKDYFEDILDGLKLVSHYKRKHKSSTPVIGFEFVMTALNAKEAPDLVDVAKAVGVERINFRPLNLVGIEERTEWLTGGMDLNYYVKILERILEKAKEAGIMTNVEELLSNPTFYLCTYGKGENRNGPVCVYPWIQAFISSTGEITPCCANQMDEGLSMGNVLKDGFDGVWNNEDYRDLRRAHKSKEIPYRSCNTCYKVGLKKLVQKVGFLPG